jgi:hypothetical protein
MRRTCDSWSAFGVAAARVSAIVVAIACAAVQLSSTFHFALVAHAVCAEHGEFIHESEGGHRHSHAADRAASPERPATVVTAAAHDDEHAHCATFADRRERLSVAPRTLAVVVLATPAKGELLLHDGEHHSPVVPLLLLAPKGSPPA